MEKPPEEKFRRLNFVPGESGNLKLFSLSLFWLRYSKLSDLREIFDQNSKKFIERGKSPKEKT